MLLLKRFEFSYLEMSYVKMNCNVAIPRTLQIPEVDAPPVLLFQNHRCVFHPDHGVGFVFPQMLTEPDV